MARDDIDSVALNLWPAISAIDGNQWLSLEAIDGSARNATLTLRVRDACRLTTGVRTGRSSASLGMPG